MRKLLPIIGLLLMVGCGQSLDTTINTSGDEEVTTETNFNRLEDIQDCLNGDKGACDRAKSEGFTNAPLFLEDLKEINELVVTNEDGVTKSYSRHYIGDDVVVFTHISVGYKDTPNSTRIYTTRTHIIIHDDYSADVETDYRWTQNGNTSGWTSWGTFNSTFNNAFHMLSDSNLEWKSHDSESLHIERIGNVEVN